jgi:hypothetical protein
MMVLFACRRYRLRDLGLVRQGVLAAGHRFQVMELPWATPLIVLAAMLRLFGVRIYLVLSDKLPGDGLLMRIFGRHATRMLWNYPDELPVPPAGSVEHRVCFFSEPGMLPDHFRFAPQPASHANVARTRPVVFVGDVTDTLPLARGSDWWREGFQHLLDLHGYDFYLHPGYESLIAQESDTAQRRLARVLAKNLLRLWIVQDARQEFGDRIVLVGSNWRRYGMHSEPSLYSERGRLDYFRSAVVNLDCGSKSGDSALYPRSSELVSFAGGLLQLRCVDAAQVFGARAHEFCFRDRASLNEAIAARLAETAGARDERDAWLVGHLSRERLLMQHSVDRMLDHKC